ncbi:hypothetical protein F5Y15DRAFT_25371 [Xylariaceae sp. FL0016]|nr:hypothetical protein F5Y15DRAFT_25371 [Xylariaceae sp. FL0016]
MKSRQPSDAAEKKPLGSELSMRKVWADAATAFEAICGESLQHGEVKSFEHVRSKIQDSGKASYDLEPDSAAGWAKAKEVGLASLQGMKVLLGVASQASALLPIPSSAANIASSALSFVFTIPDVVHGYEEAVNGVFGEVWPALSQFEIYTSLDDSNPVLLEPIQLVMVSFVKLCAHVVKYRQRGTRHRLLEKTKVVTKSLIDKDNDLAGEKAQFKRLVEQQHHVEGTMTLATVVESRRDIAELLEKSIVWDRAILETRQLAQATQRGVQSLSADADRNKTLTKIRDTLGVPSMVRLDTRTTETCTTIAEKRLNGTGDWIWKNDAYTRWTAPSGNDTSRVLLLSGPSSSGKTLASALITRHLEEEKGRTYVAHYFFDPSSKRSDEDNNPAQSALKYMAFQLARVDATARNALGKACDTLSSAIRSVSSLEALWKEFKIGAPKSGATYYLVFDGIENLPEKQVELLLKFVASPRLSEELTGRLRILVSGTDERFDNVSTFRNTLRIRMDQCNFEDMQMIIKNTLHNRGMLNNAKPGSNQEKARDMILTKLPKKAKGSYSLLHFSRDEVMRLLATRTAFEQLDKMLDASTSSHEAAIKTLERSLSTDEISELNELLQWVLYARCPLNVEELEAAMFLSSGIESLASLRYIIENKYHAVLKEEWSNIYGQDGVKDYLRKEVNKKSPARSEDEQTISMTISIKNVNEEVCENFLWDLAQKGIRDKFKFDFDSASRTHGSRRVIAVDEFEAHHMIVERAFQYLNNEASEQTKAIGWYLITWLPYHLECLRELWDQEKGSLQRGQRQEIGRNLYEMFRDETVFNRHHAALDDGGVFWELDEMETLQKWLRDPEVVRRLDKGWRDEIQRASSPTRGCLRVIARMVIQGFLRERSWRPETAWPWIREFFKTDVQEAKLPPKPRETSDSDKFTDNSSDDESDQDDFYWNDLSAWDSLSAWCRDFLELSESDIGSYWHERLAAAAQTIDSVSRSIVVSLYEKAVTGEHPSWTCHRDLGSAYIADGRIAQAIKQLDLALHEAAEEGIGEEEEQFMDLHLRMGSYALRGGEMKKAAEHYGIARRSENTRQSRFGEFGRLKSMLFYLDESGKRELLRASFAPERLDTMSEVLKLTAQHTENGDDFSILFAVAKDDPDILKHIARALEVATATATSSDDAAETSIDDRFAQDESRGVLLYHRGIVAYHYNVFVEGTDGVGEALRFWRECSDQLADIGGPNASNVRQFAATELAKHYFQHMVDAHHLDHVHELMKLAEHDSDVLRGDPNGFLGALYALNGQKLQSRAVLLRRMKQALQILSDDITSNDVWGFSGIFEALGQYQDFENMAVALSLLGLPNLVTDWLWIRRQPVHGESCPNLDLRNIRYEIEQHIDQRVKSEVPDGSQQNRRIEVARAYISSVVDGRNALEKKKAVEEGEALDEVRYLQLQRSYAVALFTQFHLGEAQALGPEDALGEDKSLGEENTRLRPEYEKMIVEHTVYQTLQDHGFKILDQMHASYMNKNTWPWLMGCLGRAKDGSACDNTLTFDREIYHCIYCTDKCFCWDCLTQLRNPDCEVVITKCSAKHRWLKIPPYGSDLYVGLDATTIHGRRNVVAAEDDANILEIHHTDDGSSVTVKAWKEMLAQEWDISLDGLQAEDEK